MRVIATFLLFCSFVSADIIQTGYQNIQSSNTIADPRHLFDDKPPMPFQDWNAEPAEFPDSLPYTAHGPDWQVSREHLFVAFEFEQEYLLDSVHLVQESIEWVHGEELWREQAVGSVELWMSNQSPFLPEQPVVPADHWHSVNSDAPYVELTFQPTRGTYVLAKINTAYDRTFGLPVERGAQVAEIRMGGTAVPEPNAFLLLGLIGLIVSGRRYMWRKPSCVTNRMLDAIPAN